MRFSVIAIGKIKESWMREGIAEYTKRLTPFAKVDITEYDEERWKGLPSPLLKEQILQKEGEKLLKTVAQEDTVILLDTKGKSFTSEALSAWIEARMTGGTSRFIWMIGGPLGNGANIQGRAALRISLGSMTLTHQMARLILMEQLYRAMKIMRREPYHL